LFRALAPKLLSFTLQFLLTFLLLLALWPFTSPLYARFTAAAGGTLLRTIALLPSGGHLEARENRVWVFRPVTRIDGTTATAGVNVLDEATYFNLVILVSLIVATPSLGWGGKGGAAASGVVVLWLLHLTDLYVKLKWTAIFPGLRLRGVVPEPATLVTVKTFEWLYAFFSVVGFGLFPILVWLGVARLWRKRESAAAHSPQQSART
jgi:hypothetical protein